MKNFLYILTLILTVGIFSSCEKCETCTFNVAFTDGDVQAIYDAAAVIEGYSDFTDWANALLEEDGISTGEVCGDDIEASKDKYAEEVDGYSTDLDGDGYVDITYSYTCD